MKCNLLVSNARQFRVDLIDSAASLFFFGIISEPAVRSGTRDEDSRLNRPTRVFEHIHGTLTQSTRHELLAGEEQCLSHVHLVRFWVVDHGLEFSAGLRYVNPPAIRLDLRGVYTYLYFERLVHTAMIYDSH